MQIQPKLYSYGTPLVYGTLRARSGIWRVAFRNCSRVWEPLSAEAGGLEIMEIMENHWKSMDFWILGSSKSILEITKTFENHWFSCISGYLCIILWNAILCFLLIKPVVSVFSGFQKDNF